MRKSRILILVWLSLAVLLAGCSSLRTRDQIQKEKLGDQQKKPDQTQGEALDEAASKDDAVGEEVGPEFQPVPDVSRAPKVGLILGPGGFKAFAHTGVIRELEKARIPIDAIVGIEWGALVAGLYAQKGQIHEAEWKLYKLQTNDIPGKSFFSAKYEPETIDSMGPFFKKNVGGMAIDKLKVQFGCPSLSIWSGTVVWQAKGDLIKALEHCVPYPPLFKPKSPWMAAGFALQESVKFLREAGMQVIILVNVLGEGDIMKQADLMDEYQSGILWQELRRYYEQAEIPGLEVISVKTRAYQMTEFKHRRSLVTAGQQAGAKAADRIAEKYGF